MTWTSVTTDPSTSLPFDHRASFEKGLFGFSAAHRRTDGKGRRQQAGRLRRAEARADQGRAVREAAGILVDEQFGAAILRDAGANG